MSPYLFFSNLNSLSYFLVSVLDPRASVFKIEPFSFLCLTYPVYFVTLLYLLTLFLKRHLAMIILSLT